MLSLGGYRGAVLGQCLAANTNICWSCQSWDWQGFMQQKHWQWGSRFYHGQILWPWGKLGDAFCSHLPAGKTFLFHFSVEHRWRKGFFLSMLSLCYLSCRLRGRLWLLCPFLNAFLNEKTLSQRNLVHFDLYFCTHLLFWNFFFAVMEREQFFSMASLDRGRRQT